MKKLFTISVIAMLAGCASTEPKDDNPIISTNFQFKQDASFARNTMFLAGSNKFVDSKSGDVHTRKVAGSSLKTAFNLLTLNFAGAAQDAMTNHLIEDEPLAKQPMLFVVVPVDKLELSITEQMALKATARKRYMEQLAQMGFVSGGLVWEDSSHFAASGTSPVCDFTRQYTTYDQPCEVYSSKGKILRTATDNGNNIAVIGFELDSAMKAALFATVLDKNQYIYIKSRSPGRIAYGLAAPVVIHDGKVHKFIKGADESKGLPLKTLDITYRIDDSFSKSGKNDYFKFNMQTLKLELMH